MNKPMRPPVPDPDIGPLDEHGQQIWSLEEEAAIAQIMADPDFWPSIQQSREATARGDRYTAEEVAAELDRRRRAWREAH